MIRAKTLPVSERNWDGETMAKEKPSSKKGDELWPMGAVTRRTGITEHTLRAWERRFGFPQPIRLPSGHRRFTADQVQRLLLINQALRCGYRAGDIVPLEPGRIEKLIRESGLGADDAQSILDPSRWVEEVLRDAIAFDEPAVRNKMVSEAATLGARRFLRDRAVPLIRELGEGWERGDLGIRHEHFVTGILDEFLGELRHPYEATSAGRPVVLACLPGELHGLGLQLVAAEVATAGRKNLVLGPHTPIDEIVATAEVLDAAAVGLSVSIFAPSEETLVQVADLRQALPSKTVLWVGGGGAPGLGSLPKGSVRVESLDDVAEVVRQL